MDRVAERRPCQLLLRYPRLSLAVAPSSIREQLILHSVGARFSARDDVILEQLEVIGFNPQRLVHAGRAVEVDAPPFLDVIVRVAVSELAVERGFADESFDSYPGA